MKGSSGAVSFGRVFDWRRTSHRSLPRPQEPLNAFSALDDFGSSSRHAIHSIPLPVAQPLHSQTEPVHMEGMCTTKIAPTRPGRAYASSACFFCISPNSAKRCLHHPSAAGSLIREYSVYFGKRPRTGTSCRWRGGSTSLLEEHLAVRCWKSQEETVAECYDTHELAMLAARVMISAGLPTCSMYSV